MKIVEKKEQRIREMESSRKISGGGMERKHFNGENQRGEG